MIMVGPQCKIPFTMNCVDDFGNVVTVGRRQQNMAWYFLGVEHAITVPTGTTVSPMPTSIDSPLESTSQQAGVRLSTSRD